MYPSITHSNFLQRHYGSPSKYLQLEKKISCLISHKSVLPLLKHYLWSSPPYMHWGIGCPCFCDGHKAPLVPVGLSRCHPTCSPISSGACPEHSSCRWGCSLNNSPSLEEELQPLCAASPKTATPSTGLCLRWGLQYAGEVALDSTRHRGVWLGTIITVSCSGLEHCLWPHCSPFCHLFYCCLHMLVTAVP